MAKIRNSKPKISSGGYLRLVGNERMANIFTKAQSANIRNGNELEQIIFNNIPKSNTITNIDEFIDDCKNGRVVNGFYFCDGKSIFNSKYRLGKHQPDILMFSISAVNTCCVVELKDGDDFDTKKSQSEKNSLIAITNHLQSLFGKIFEKIDYKICCFNQNDKTKVINGLKKRFTIDEVVTGKELCNMLGIDYEKIINERQNDATDNFNYIIEEMCNLDQLRTKVIEIQKNIVSHAEFY